MLGSTPPSRIDTIFIGLSLKASWVQGQQHVQEQEAARKAREAGGDAQEIIVARLVGTLIGRITAADEAAHSWSTKVGLQAVISMPHDRRGLSAELMTSAV